MESFPKYNLERETAEAPMRAPKRFMMSAWIKWVGIYTMVFWGGTGCFQGSESEGSPALKLFSALGISLAAVVLIFYIVVKIREKN